MQIFSIYYWISFWCICKHLESNKAYSTFVASLLSPETRHFKVSDWLKFYVTLAPVLNVFFLAIFKQTNVFHITCTLVQLNGVKKTSVYEVIHSHRTIIFFRLASTKSNVAFYVSHVQTLYKIRGDPISVTWRTYYCHRSSATKHQIYQAVIDQWHSSISAKGIIIHVHNFQVHFRLCSHQTWLTVYLDLSLCTLNCIAFVEYRSGTP